MKSSQITGLILLILGIGIIIYGINVQNSVNYQFAKAFGSGAGNVVVMMFGGGVVAFIGLILLCVGNGQQEDTETSGQNSSQTIDLTNDENTSPTKDEYLEKALSKSDDELKEIIRQKEDYNPKLVNNAKKVLIARMTGTEIVVNKQNTDSMDGQ